MPHGLLLGAALAALVGISLGLLGGGGSILTVPIFVYVLGYPPKQAIAMSLPVVGVTSLVGALRHWRAGNVRLPTAFLFGVVAMTGSFVAARLAGKLQGELQLVILAVVMLAAALSMLRSSAARTEPEPRQGALALLLVTALGVGALTGLIGIGGGFLIVPALVVLARVPMKQSVGTSLLVIAMNCVSGYLGYIGREPMAWDVLAVFTAVACLGIFAGTALVHVIQPRQLKRAFAVFLLVVGALIMYENRQVFRGAVPAATAR